MLQPRLWNAELCVNKNKLCFDVVNVDIALKVVLIMSHDRDLVLSRSLVHLISLVRAMLSDYILM